MPVIRATAPDFGISVNYGGGDGYASCTFYFEATVGTATSAVLSWTQGGALAGGACQIGPSSGYYPLTHFMKGNNSAELLNGGFSIPSGTTALTVYWRYPYPGGSGWRKSTFPISGLVLTITTQQLSHNVTVSSSPDGAGNARANPTSAAAGTLISLSQIPAGGYVFDGWSSTPSVTIVNNQFTMPDSDITVVANYHGTPSGPTFNHSVTRTTTVDGERYKDAGRYVQNHSGLIASMSNITPASGRSVLMTSIEVMGYDGSQYYATGTGDLSLTSGLLFNGGYCDVRFTAIDSEGYATFEDETVYVEPYSNPHLEQLNVWRTDAQGEELKAGEYAKIKYGFAVTAADGWNQYTASLKFNGRTVQLTETSGEMQLTDAGGEAERFSYDSTFIVTLEVTDKLETKYWYGTIKSAPFLLHFAADGSSVAVGHACPEGPDGANRFTISDDMTLCIGGYSLAEYILAVMDGDIR